MKSQKVSRDRSAGYPQARLVLEIPSTVTLENLARLDGRIRLPTARGGLRQFSKGMGGGADVGRESKAPNPLHMAPCHFTRSLAFFSSASLSVRRRRWAIQAEGLVHCCSCNDSPLPADACLAAGRLSRQSVCRRRRCLEGIPDEVPREQLNTTSTFRLGVATAVQCSATSSTGQKDRITC